MTLKNMFRIHSDLLQLAIQAKRCFRLESLTTIGQECIEIIARGH